MQLSFLVSTCWVAPNLTCKSPHCAKIVCWKIADCWQANKLSMVLTKTIDVVQVQTFWVFCLERKKEDSIHLVQLANLFSCVFLFLLNYFWINNFTTLFNLLKDFVGKLSTNLSFLCHLCDWWFFWKLSVEEKQVDVTNTMFCCCVTLSSGLATGKKHNFPWKINGFSKKLCDNFLHSNLFFLDLRTTHNNKKPPSPLQLRSLQFHPISLCYCHLNNS